MNIQTEANLKRRIKEDPEQKVYFLYGEEKEKIKRYSLIIQKSKGEVDKKTYYGDDLITDELELSSKNLSLFEEKKLFLIKKSELISSKKWENILKTIEKSPAENSFIFESESLDNRKSYAKSLKKNSFFILHCAQPDRGSFLQWANAVAKEEGKKISAAAIRSLMESGGLSISELSHSIKKIALYIGNESEIIQENHVKEIIYQTKPEIIFEYIDSIIQKNQKKALKQVLSLYRQGEEPIAIVALLGKQYRWMISILNKMQKKQRLEQISRELRIMPQLARKLITLCKQKGRNKIIEDMELLTKADKELKTSMKPPQLILDSLSIALTR